MCPGCSQSAHFFICFVANFSLWREFEEKNVMQRHWSTHDTPGQQRRQTQNRASAGKTEDACAREGETVFRSKMILFPIHQRTINLAKTVVKYRIVPQPPLSKRGAPQVVELGGSAFLDTEEPKSHASRGWYGRARRGRARIWHRPARAAVPAGTGEQVRERGESAARAPLPVCS